MQTFKLLSVVIIPTQSETGESNYRCTAIGELFVGGQSQGPNAMEFVADDILEAMGTAYNYFAEMRRAYLGAVN